MNATTTPNLIDDVRRMLVQSVTDVFATMFSMEATLVAPHDPDVSDQEIVAGSVGFGGEVNGVVYIHVTAAFARTLASRMLGLPEAELEGDEMVNDVIGELSNMVVGSVKSQLCDSGSSCTLTIPSIVRGRSLTIERLRSSDRRLVSLKCGEENVDVELLMKHR